MKLLKLNSTNIKLQIRTPYNVILINLAVVELVIAMVGITMDVQSLIRDGFGFGRTACEGTGAAVTTSG